MKSILYILFCLLIHGVKSEEICANPNEVISCDADCTGRKFCVTGSVETINCYSQTGRKYCNPDTLQCQSTPAHCGVDNYFVCPGEGYFPHLLDCTRFYICVNVTKAVMGDCANSVFNPKNQMCSTGTRCYSFSPVDGLCKRKEGKIILHPLNNSLYVLCSESGPKLGACLFNKVFNIKTLECEYDCEKRGVFADAEDSTCYYTCSGLLSSLKSEHSCCQKGYYFNSVMNACLPLGK